MDIQMIQSQANKLIKAEALICFLLNLNLDLSAQLTKKQAEVIKTRDTFRTTSSDLFTTCNEIIAELKARQAALVTELETKKEEIALLATSNQTLARKFDQLNESFCNARKEFATVSEYTESLCAENEALKFELAEMARLLDAKTQEVATYQEVERPSQLCSSVSFTTMHFDDQLSTRKSLSVDQDSSSINNVLDQCDENRFFSNRRGRCEVRPIQPNGVFWIRPMAPFMNLRQTLSKHIGDFITKSKLKSFGELKTRPSVYSKCFVRICMREMTDHWSRGFIEGVKEENTFYVRALDAGYMYKSDVCDIFPYQNIELTLDGQTRAESEINYLAIRCCLEENSPFTRNGRFQISREFREEFQSKVEAAWIHYSLTKQVNVSNPMKISFPMKAWVVELTDTKGCSILNELRGKLGGREIWKFVENMPKGGENGVTNFQYS